MSKVQQHRIWRMTHYRNVGFILKNGLHCCNCEVKDENFISIGFKTLVARRGNWPVTIDPGGVLNDYVPFYFHCKMPMLFKIYSGEVPEYIGSQNDIIYLVSSVEKIMELKIPFVFTDRHAYVVYRDFYNGYTDLEKLSWDIIKDHNWYTAYSQRRKEKKQAEFLVYRHMPVQAILGIVAQNEEVATFVRNEVTGADLNLQVIVKPDHYYP